MLLYENRHTAMRHRMLKASATLEATLVIPLYVYAVLAVMFVIRLLNVYVDVDRAAYNTAREMCKYAYLYDKQDNLGIPKATDRAAKATWSLPKRSGCLV